MALFNKKFQTQQTDIIASVDIGSSKICCAIAKREHRLFDEQNNEQNINTLKILGFGQQISKGIKNGSIVDVEQLEDSLINAIHTAEQTSGLNISSVFINIPTNLVKIYRINSNINVSGRPIDDQHIKRILNLGRDSNIDPHEQIIHIFAQSYSLDAVKNIIDPRGMIGDALTAHLIVLTAPIVIIRNISACLGRCHLDIDEFVVGGYASALSTLVEDEKKLGSTVIDIGGSTTTITSFYENKLIDIASIPIGGSHITNDIARILGTPISQAERLKNLYGTLLRVSEDEREMIVIPQLGEQYNNMQNNNVSKFYLSEIIRCRIEEIFEYIYKYIKTSNIDPVVYQRFVLTGGTSQLSGLRELATDLLYGQVRIGIPIHISGSSDFVQTPLFSTCAGLLRFANHEEIKKIQIKTTHNNHGKIQKAINWIRENF
jgi:cell division protein FtsA